jgi:hypothetical protein
MARGEIAFREAAILSGSDDRSLLERLSLLGLDETAHADLREIAKAIEPVMPVLMQRLHGHS